MPRSIGVVAVAALAVGLFSIGAAAQEIGSVAAANRDIDGTPPGAQTRALLLGDRVISNERVVSSPVGSGQMLFLDQTSLTVSPNSEIVLDRYVYDPETETGEIGLTVARGVMRMVGGRITKSTEARIGTPTATIGVRGGIALIVVGEDDTTRVMHVAGEYTRVEAGGETLNLTRSNALAVVGAGAPEYLGVATEADVAALYDQMQGGGGGSDESIESDDVENAGVSAVNSESPDAVSAAPISTSGERTASDDSIEVGQLTIVSDAEVTNSIVEIDDTTTMTTNPFADFSGGVIFVDSTPFTDVDGSVVQDPVAQNFLFAGDTLEFVAIRQGSIIGTLEGGLGDVRLPTPAQSGFFDVDPAQTASPFGQFGGRAFADIESGVYAYSLRNQGGIGGALFAQPGPTQLRGLNTGNDNFRVTPFRVLPDLQIASETTTVPFLPPGLGQQFDNGTETSIFFISEPNSPGFALGTSGFVNDAGIPRTNYLLPVFRLSGSGQSQSYLMSVGAQRLVNSGTDRPSLLLFTRGSLRQDPVRTPDRISQPIGATAVGPEGQEVTVLGANDDYLLLGNELEFGRSNTSPDAQTSVSFLQNIASFDFDTYGNTHLAQRLAPQDLAPNTRFSIGSTPAAYAAETGRTGANQFTASQTRFLSFAYSAGAATYRDGFFQSDKFLLRTAGMNDGGAAGFGLTTSTGSVALRMDETLDSPDITSALLVFGGSSRSGVIDQNRYGMREAFNPASFENTLLNSGETSNVIGTNMGPLPARPQSAVGNEDSARLALLSHGLADASDIYPANTPLTPQYLTWGWWTGYYRADDNPNAQGDPRNDARVQFHLGTWVAGNRTNVLPPTGAFTYNGPVTVNNLAANGADFVDGGRFTLNYDFSERSGQARFQDVLNLPAFNVGVNDSTGRRGVNDYGGDRSFAPGGDMTNVRVDGSFFDGPQNNDVRATAGSLRIQNQSGSIKATGTYWGER